MIEKEEVKKAKERFIKIKSEQAKIQRPEGSKEFKKGSDKSQIKDLSDKVDKIQEELGKGGSMKAAADKVKISHETLRKTKKIKQVIEKDKKDKKDNKDKIIEKEWNKALKGEIGTLFLSRPNIMYQKNFETSFIMIFGLII